MKITRSTLFFALVCGLLTLEQGRLIGMTFFDCPSGCDCEFSPGYGSVSGDCPDEAGADGVCEDAYDECLQYCDIDYENYVNWGSYPQQYSCFMYAFNSSGCWPHGLEPPTSFTCSCLCYPIN